MKAEALDGETLEETLEVSEVKKEETLELKIDDYEDDLDNTPEDISVKEEDPDTKNYLCKATLELPHYTLSSALEVQQGPLGIYAS